MSIQIQKQLVVADSQTYKCENVTMQKAGEWTASVTFGIYNENGERVDQVVLSYEAPQFNDFWAGFNSGTYLYEQLVAQQGLTVTVPNSEGDFVN